MTEAISISMAACGALMLAMLYARIRTASAGMRLDRHRSRDAGLADLLNYAAMVDDGIIVGKNGAFMAACSTGAATTPAAPKYSANWCRSASTRPCQLWAAAG